MSQNRPRGDIIYPGQAISDGQTYHYRNQQRGTLIKTSSKKHINCICTASCSCNCVGTIE